MSTETEPVTVFVADDHPAVRAGLRAAINGTHDLVVVSEAGSVEEAQRVFRERTAQVAVVDLRLGDQPGERLIRSLLRLEPGVGILVVSMYLRLDYIHEALTAGAHGYVTKQVPVEHVVAGVRAVGAGGYYFDPPSMQLLTEQINRTSTRVANGSDDRYGALTEREQEVFRLLAEGMTPKEIAAVIELSHRTVENYQTSIYRKLELSSKTALVRYAMELGVI